jgi:hypothetical protein
MSSITRTRVLSSSLRRTCLRSKAAVPTIHSRLAHQDYGSGEGDPKGEKPQKQGANPSADKEHPGPPPPKAGEGSGSGPTKGTSEGHNTTSGSGSSTQKRQFSTMRMLWAAKKPKSTEGLQPKILNESPPTSEEESDDVKKHNEEFTQRAERAHEGVENKDAEKDKVSSKFWSGELHSFFYGILLA